MTGPIYRYDAFISYRHVEPDRMWAKWLHKALETFRTPRTLVAKGVAPRIRRVFRDEEELPASADLSQEIHHALEQSRYLIVVCSPRAPASEWVNQEVVRFREMGRHDQILALLIEGEPAQAFPRALCEIRTKITDDQGETTEHIEDVEPLAADLRATRGEPERFLKRMALLRFSATLLGCRFDDLRRRDTERRRRRLLIGASATLMVAIALAGLSVYAIAEQSRAEGEWRRAESERDLKSKALDEVLRLADSKKINDLITAEAGLWPIHPHVAPRMMTWIHEVEMILGRLPEHEASLKRLRSSGLHTPAHEAIPESWDFTNDQDAWRHEVLAGVVQRLRSLAAEDGLLARVRKRHGDAHSLHQRSIGAHRDAWTAVAKRVKASPKYAGFALSAQIGLVPLGPDPNSGLEEFAHLGSGSLPTRGNDGALACPEDAAIILVLIPAGTFWMGAQKEDPKGRNFDPAARSDEQPVHEVAIEAPYFLAKHEVTQAQWASMADDRHPSYYTANKKVFRGQALTLRNPVEEISWLDCSGSGPDEGWLHRHNLVLPTEAWWEYGCRGGNPDGKSPPWWSGSEVSSLSSAANIADAYAKRMGDPSWSYETDVDDGYLVHAPVGSLKPNAFGLHDVHGNVFEWCRDIDRRYGTQLDARARPVYRNLRGGTFSLISTVSRSAARSRNTAKYRNFNLGVRAARAVDP